MTAKDYKFSVAMSVYKSDNPIFFDDALNSILVEQTTKPDEVVIVVDGPVPKKIDNVIEKYQALNNKLKVVRLKENGGLGNALKIAVENCKYNYIARMDSDDISVKCRFEEQIKFFKEHKDVDIVGGDIAEFIGEKENIVAKRIVPKTDLEIKNYMKKRCAMNHASVMFKKEAVMNAGDYIDWHYNEDYYLWIRMCLNNCVFANTGTVLYLARVGEEMYQRRGGYKYFISEKNIQKYMLKNHMINVFRYFVNVTERFVIQMLLTNKMRGFIYKKFARKQ